MSTVAPGPQSDISTGKYTVGTLSYTWPGMLMLMFWLLFGDFCFSLMESVVPSVLPLMLANLDTPNWLIAVFLSTIPSIFNATVCPVVSYMSDRHRSPLGRRIPFILYTLPFLCFFLVMIGFAPTLARWVSQFSSSYDPRIVALILLGLFVTGFQFFNMFVASVYYYLFNDVVPHEYLGRFLAVFRSVGTLASSFYFFFVFPKAETHYFEIFLGAALLYGVVFVLMCRNVREGHYPPPTPLRGGSGIIAGFKTFFVESFSHRFYWSFYLFVSFWAVAVNAGAFHIFFCKSIGLSLDQIGQYAGTALIVGAILLIPCGYLSDRFSPIRTLLFAAIFQSILSTLPLIFLFFSIPQQWVFLTYSIVLGINVPIAALFTASELPTGMQLLPRQQYGQFSASTALVRSLVVIVAGLLCGIFLDLLRPLHEDPSMAYRYLPFWTAFFQGLAAFFLWQVYREWKARGGIHHFTPPSLESAEL